MTAVLDLRALLTPAFVAVVLTDAQATDVARLTAQRVARGQVSTRRSG